MTLRTGQPEGRRLAAAIRSGQFPLPSSPPVNRPPSASVPRPGVPYNPVPPSPYGPAQAVQPTPPAPGANIAPGVPPPPPAGARFTPANPAVSPSGAVPPPRPGSAPQAPAAPSSLPGVAAPPAVANSAPAYVGLPKGSAPADPSLRVSYSVTTAPQPYQIGLSYSVVAPPRIQSTRSNIDVHFSPGLSVAPSYSITAPRFQNPVGLSYTVVAPPRAQTTGSTFGSGVTSTARLSSTYGTPRDYRVAPPRTPGVGRPRAEIFRKPTSEMNLPKGRLVGPRVDSFESSGTFGRFQVSPTIRVTGDPDFRAHSQRISFKNDSLASEILDQRHGTWLTMMPSLYGTGGGALTLGLNTRESSVSITAHALVSANGVVYLGVSEDGKTLYYKTTSGWMAYTKDGAKKSGEPKIVIEVSVGIEGR